MKKVENILTIGFPVYNASKDLELALKSVLNQTYRDFTLLIVNDGSTDNSMEIIKEFKDDRIVIIDDGLNKGLAIRLNEIIDLTETKYLARMDADDLISLDKIQKQMEVLLGDPSIDVLGTNAFSLDKSGNIQGVRFPFFKDSRVRDVDAFIHASIIGKSEWFKANKYDAQLRRMQDTELWFRTRSFSNFKELSDPFYYYREESGNYYKKYLKSIPLFWYVTKKNNYSPYWIFRTFKVSSVTMLYYMLNLIGKENLLLQRRNIVIDEDVFSEESSKLKKLVKYLSSISK